MASLPPPPLSPPPGSDTVGSWTGMNTAVQSVLSRREVREAELKALRQRGLARSFHRHFTETADSIARERAAAELALQELERRKEEIRKKPMSYTQNDGKSVEAELGMLEKMCMVLKKRKDGVRRKERETQELYRRYCAQYGKRAPGVPGAAPPDAPPSPKKSRNLPTVGEHHTEGHEEDADHAVRQADLLLKKMLESTGNDFEADGPCAKDMARDFESNEMSKHSPVPLTEGNAGRVPGVHWKRPPLRPPAPPLAPPLPKPTFRGGSVPMTPSSSKMMVTIPPSKGAAAVKDREENGTAITAASSTAIPPYLLPPGFDEDEGNDSDDVSEGSTISAISGITSACSGTVNEAELRFADFLRTETENIRRMLETEEGDAESVGADTIASKEAVLIKEAGKAAEDMVKQMEDMMAWTKTDSGSLRGYIPHDEGQTGAKGKGKSGGSADGGGETWVAFWSDEHRKVFYHQTSTGQTVWSKPVGVAVDTSKLAKPDVVPYADLGGDEDSVVVKDYTKVSKSVSSGSFVDAGAGARRNRTPVRGGRARSPSNESQRSVRTMTSNAGRSVASQHTQHTQRSARTMTSNAGRSVASQRTSVSQYTHATHATFDSSDDFRPDSMKKGKGRNADSVAEYRRRRRRARKKKRLRIIAAMGVTGAIAGGATYFVGTENIAQAVGSMLPEELRAYLGKFVPLLADSTIAVAPPVIVEKDDEKKRSAAKKKKKRKKKVLSPETAKPTAAEKKGIEGNSGGGGSKKMETNPAGIVDSGESAEAKAKIERKSVSNTGNVPGSGTGLHKNPGREEKASLTQVPKEEKKIKVELELKPETKPEPEPKPEPKVEPKLDPEPEPEPEPRVQKEEPQKKQESAEITGEGEVDSHAVAPVDENKQGIKVRTSFKNHIMGGLFASHIAPHDAINFETAWGRVGFVGWGIGDGYQ